MVNMLMKIFLLVFVYYFQLGLAMYECNNNTLNEVVSSMRTMDQDLSAVLIKCLNATGMNGEEFMQTLKGYNKKIEEFLQCIAEDKLRALSAAEDILNKGGPDFLDEDAEDDQIMKCFNWNEDQLNKMYKSRLTSFRLWNQLVMINNNFP